MRLTALTVRTATRLQLKGVREDRANICLRYIKNALNTDGPEDPPADASMALKTLSPSLGALWRLKWEPQNKETLWRLINNGVSGAGGHDNPSPKPCP